MIGSQFIGKTMVVLFTVPLLAQADIQFNAKPVQQLITQKQAADDKTIEQMKVATEGLAMSVQMNAQAHQAYTGTSGEAYVQDEKFKSIMNNLNQLTSEAESKL